MQDKTRQTRTATAKNAVSKDSMSKIVNTKSRIWRKGVKLDRRRKPQCAAVRLNGRVHIVGQSAAAAWLGMSRTTFAAAVIGRKDIAAETIALVRKEYPELFNS